MHRLNSKPLIFIASTDPHQEECAHTLRDAGFDVMLFDDGIACETQIAVYQPELLVLSDILPGCTGIEISQRLQASPAPRPFIIMLVKDWDPETLDRAFHAGASDCTLQPAHKRILAQRVRNLLSPERVPNRVYSRLYDLLPSPVFMCHRDGVLSMVNQQFCALVELSREELIGTNLTQYVSGTERNAIFRSLKLLQLGENSALQFSFDTQTSQIPVRVLVKNADTDLFVGMVNDLRPEYRTASELKHSEQKYRDLFNASRDAVIITDTQFDRIIDANPYAANLLGYAPDELLHLKYKALIANTESLESIHHQLTHLDSLIYEAGYRCKDGTILEIEISAQQIEYDGQPAILTAARDITHRNLIAQREREQRLLAEAMMSSTSALSSALKLDVLLDRILEVVENLIPADSVNFMLIFEDDLTEVIGRRGREDQFIKPRTRAFPYRNVMTLRWIVENKSILYVPDIASFPGWFNTDTEHWMKSYIGAPIIVDDAVIGFINVDGAKVNQFSGQHVQYLKAFADQASIAIRNARLYERIQHHADELEQRVTERTEALAEINRSLQQEIDRRAEIERILKEERNLLRTLLDSLPDPILVKDREGRFTLLNVAAMRLMRMLLPQGELLGLTDFDVALRGSAQISQAEDRHVFETGLPIFNKELERLDERTGRKMYVLISKIPLFDADNSVNAVLSINRDITELRRVEHEMAHVITSANCLLWYANVRYTNNKLNWDMRIANDDVAQQFLPLMIGRGESYINAWDRAIFVEDLEAMRNHTRSSLLAGASSYTTDARFRRADGEVRWINFDVRVTPLQENHWSLVGVCTDVTERKTVEELLRRANETLERRVSERTVEVLRAAEQLRASEEKYATLTNNLPIGVYRISPDSRILYLNTAMARMLGYDYPDELLGKSVETFYIDEGFLRIMNARPATVNRVHKNELRLRTRHGEVIWVMNSWHMMFDGQGNIISYDGTLENITERKKAEQAEREQRILAEALSDAVSDINGTLKLDEVLDRMTRQIERVMPEHDGVGIMLIEDDGYMRQIRYELKSNITQTLERRYRFDDVPNFVYMFKTGQPVVISDTFNDPRWMRISETDWVGSYLGAPIPSEGEVIGFINLTSRAPNTFTEEHGPRLLAFANQLGIAVRNAQLYAQVQAYANTLRQQVEERTAELRQQTRLLNAILNGMVEGVVYYDALQRPVFTNRAMQNLTGYHLRDRSADSLFASLVAPFDDPHQFRRILEYEIAERGMWRSEVKVKHINGRVFDADLTITRVDGDEDKLMGAVAVLRDISHEKALADQRRKFIAYASHELRTPLTNIGTRLYLLRKQPEKQADHLNVIETVVGRMRQLTEDLLDLSRIENGVVNLNRTYTDLNALVSEVILINYHEAEKRNITIVHQQLTPSAAAYVDVPRMWRVLVNLLTNALNYTPEGGVITVDVLRNGDRVGVKVKDTGVGIPEELREDIFRLFVRGKTDRSGSGLGLTIAREIVEQHGGSIQLESEVGVGSAFIVWLDLAESPYNDGVLK